MTAFYNWPRLLLLGTIVFLGYLSSSTWDVLAAASPVVSARVSEISSWLPQAPGGPGRPASDRTAWENLAKDPDWSKLIGAAEDLVKTPIPPLPDDLFLDFSKTGNRTRCQSVLGRRDRRLTSLALAEALEYQGRFIKPLSEIIQAISTEKTWVLPAHDRSLENFNGKVVDMDLRATLIGWELASIHWVLGDKLPPDTRTLIEKEVQRRILHPFREVVEGRQKGCYWLKATHNWNSVCLAGVAGAALALEPKRDERAWFVAASEHFIDNFFKGFTPDGYCSEGMGYWNYGFGRFLMLSESVRQATGGKLDFFALPESRYPALYSVRSHVMNGLYPSIADCHPGSRPDPVFVRYIAERFDLKNSDARQARFGKPEGSFAPSLVFAFMPEPLPRVSQASAAPESPLRTWFSDGGVLICRPAAGPTDAVPFAAVLKGGNNAEHHNHNDVGSFSVVSGKTVVLCDPGAETYTARTFSNRRYDSKVLNSFGHMVPLLAGKMQRSGAEARGKVLKTEFSDEADLLALDISSAYTIPELKTLERTFVFRRGAQPSLSITDRIVFSAPQTIETALVTWGEWKRADGNTLVITDGADSVQVNIDTGGLPFKLSSTTLDEDVSTPVKPVRIAISLDTPAATANIRLTVTPGK